jgi:hypothetical protein
MTRRMTVMLLCAALMLLVGLRLLSRAKPAPVASASVVFYLLEEGTPVRLAIGTATALELAVHFAGPGSVSQPLDLVFRALSGAELARETVAPPAPSAAQGASVGASSRPLWLALAPPAGAAVLEVSSARAGALIRLIGGTPNPLLPRSQTHRTGVAENLLTADEERRLTRLQWTPLPALSDTATVVASTPPQLAVPEVPAERAAPRADLRVALTGAKLATRGGSSTWSHGWFQLRRGVLRHYVLDGLAPIRLSACRSVPGASDTLSWRLLRAQRELAHGSVSLPAGVDAFSLLTEAGTRSPLGLPVQRKLGPEGADVLELSAGVDTLVKVDTWLDAGADPRPVEPIVAAPVGFRWLGVPVRAAHWLALRPHVSSLEPEPVPARVEFTARLEAVVTTKVVGSSFVALHPASGHTTELVEPTLHASSHPTTLLRVPTEARLFVTDTGARARQVTASCQAGGAQGGELSLSVDGVVRARAPLTARTLQLRASVEPGDHRVSLAGPAAYCLLDARPAQGEVYVHRTAYELPPGGSLHLPVETAGSVRTVYVAIYGADSHAGRLLVRIDDGHPRRQPGVFTTSTAADAARAMKLSPSQATRLPDAAKLHRSFTRIVLGDDLVPGHHVLELSLEGSSRAWARFWTAGHAVHHEKVKLWIAEEPSE